MTRVGSSGLRESAHPGLTGSLGRTTEQFFIINNITIELTAELLHLAAERQPNCQFGNAARFDCCSASSSATKLLKRFNCSAVRLFNLFAPKFSRTGHSVAF